MDIFVEYSFPGESIINLLSIINSIIKNLGRLLTLFNVKMGFLIVFLKNFKVLININIIINANIIMVIITGYLSSLFE